MMAWLRNAPIRRKLTVFTLVTSGASLMLALFALFFWQLQQARREAARDLSTVAAVAADNAAGPLAFRDRDAAIVTLTAMRSETDIVKARLLDDKGVEFASVSFRGHEPHASALRQPISIEGSWVFVTQPVVYRGERLGALELTADVSGTLWRFAATAAVALLVVLALALLTSHLIASPLQRGITAPLTTLAETAQAIARNKDYTLRAPGQSGDEIGRVTAAFNEMLAEVHRRDEALSEAQRRLADQVQQLQHEIAERQRAQDARLALERKLEEAQRLESLGVLAGGIAHDFNNILTGILASASLARLDARSGIEIEPNLARIENNARRAAELCQQMLAYAGKGQWHGWAAVDINALVRDTLELVHVSIPKDADLRIELAPALPSVHGDASRLRQVMMNLVLNAAEALGEAPRQLRIRTRRTTVDTGEFTDLSHPAEAKPGDYVVVEVSDSGVGMTDETLRRIFEPFYTTKFAGRGLGLSAVLGIVRSHHGALDVKSAPGNGTTFQVFFPADAKGASGQAALRTPRPSSEGSGLAAARPGRRATILVVDDERDVRDLAAASLRKNGFEVQTVEDGATAIALVQRQPDLFDGVLLDLTMPQMDGLRTLEKLRQIRPKLRAILMSGFDPTQAHDRSGVKPDLFLSKPFGVVEIVECVGRLIDGAGE